MPDQKTIILLNERAGAVLRSSLEVLRREVLRGFARSALPPPPIKFQHIAAERF
jgi:hypothetical protein